MKPRTRADIIGYMSIALGSIATGGITHNVFWGLAVLAFFGLTAAMVEESKQE